jgi:hypothetical protein
MRKVYGTSLSLPSRILLPTDVRDIRMVPSLRPTCSCEFLVSFSLYGSHNRALHVPETRGPRLRPLFLPPR